MTENGTDWRLVAAEEARQRNKAEEALVEMRRFLFDYFHLLGPDPLENINVVVRTLGKVLGSDVALYNRLENGILKTWSIDNEPPGFKREDHPQGHICYDMTISHHGPTNIEAVVLNDLEGSEWETLDSNVRQYGLKSYLGFPVLVEGQVVGSLCVVDTRKRRYTDVEQYIIAAFSSAIRLEEERLLTQNRLAAAIADLKEKNEQIERMALTDSLTDLPNRRAMIGFLDREIATLAAGCMPPGTRSAARALPLSCVISTGSKPSTTPTVTPAATRCSNPWQRSSATTCAARTWRPAGAARNSSCCSGTWMRTRRWRWPNASGTSSPPRPLPAATRPSRSP